MGDILLTAIKAFKRNSKFSEPLLKILASTDVFTFVPANSFSPDRPLERVSIIQEGPEEKRIGFIAFFSDEAVALDVLKRFLDRQDNQTRQIDLATVNAMDLLAFSDRRNLPVCYNPRRPGVEQKLFSVEEIQGLLLNHWAEALVKVGPRMRPRKTKKETSSEPPKAFSAADFAAPMTAEQMAGLFAVDIDFIEEVMHNLAERHIIDRAALGLVPDNASAEGEAAELPVQLYQPLVAFHIGYQLDSDHGREFRRWHAQLLYDYCLTKGRDAAEKIELQRRLAGLSRVLQAREQRIKEMENELKQLREPKTELQDPGQLS